MSSLFPFPSDYQLPKKSPSSSAKNVSYGEVLKHIWPLLTPERQQRIEQVVQGRTYDISVVLENIYDRGNSSAVMRSAEALGLALVDSINATDKFKESQRTTAGADKWVEVRHWKNTMDCVKQLKSEGRQIVVTYLSEKSKNISEVDFSKPTALVLGNEKDGATPEIVAAADHCVILPMVGFVQSYNISVAGALCFYHIYMDRCRRLGQSGSLTEEQKSMLRAVYALRTQPSADDILNHL